MHTHKQIHFEDGCLHVSIYMCVCLFMCLCVGEDGCVCVCLCVCVCVYVCVCGRVYVCLSNANYKLQTLWTLYWTLTRNITEKKILADRSAKHTTQNIGHTHTHKHIKKTHTHTISFYIYIYNKTTKKTFSRPVDLANHSQFCAHAHIHTTHTQTNKYTLSQSLSINI